MKALRNLYLGLSLATIILITAIPVTAQQYKEDFNSAQEAAKTSAWEVARGLFAGSANGADEASDSDVAQRARYAAAQIDYKLGTTAFKAEDYAAALEHYSNGESIYPAYIKNQYGRGLALNKLGRIDEALDSWLAVVNAPGDRKTSLTAEKRIRSHFISQASAALGKPNPTPADADAALEALVSLSEYMEPDADVHYYTALAHYTKGEGESAVSSAQTALELHSGSRSDKAKIYYVLGEAYVSINDRGAARDAFQNATFGTWKQSAEHYLETL